MTSHTANLQNRAEIGIDQTMAVANRSPTPFYGQTHIGFTAMNRKEIARIERSLGFALPDYYSTFLIDFPQRLADAYPDDHSPDVRELFNTAEPIISTNALVCTPDHLIDGRDPNSKWPDKFLIVGMDIGSNFYCLDRQVSPSPVYFWFHEDGEFEKYAKSLAKLADILIKKYSGR